MTTSPMDDTEALIAAALVYAKEIDCGVAIEENHQIVDLCGEGHCSCRQLAAKMMAAYCSRSQLTAVLKWISAPHTDLSHIVFRQEGQLRARAALAAHCVKEG